MKKTLVFALAVLILGSTSVAHAQFSKLKGLTGGNQASDGSAEAVVDHFVGSYGEVLAAQVKFSEAFDLQDQVALLQAEQKAISSGQIDTDALKKTKKISEEADRAIQEKMAAQPELSGASRATFTEGLVHYGKGLVTAKQTVDAAQGAASSLAGNPLTMTGKARTGAYVAREVPGYFRNLQKSTQMVFDYGRRNHIEPPSDATSLLAGL